MSSWPCSLKPGTTLGHSQNTKIMQSKGGGFLPRASGEKRVNVPTSFLEPALHGRPWKCWPSRDTLPPHGTHSRVRKAGHQMAPVKSSCLVFKGGVSSGLQASSLKLCTLEKRFETWPKPKLGMLVTYPPPARALRHLPARPPSTSLQGLTGKGFIKLLLRALSHHRGLH